MSTEIHSSYSLTAYVACKVEIGFINIQLIQLMRSSFSGQIDLHSMSTYCDLYCSCMNAWKALMQGNLEITREINEQMIEIVEIIVNNEVLQQSDLIVDCALDLFIEMVYFHTRNGRSRKKIHKFWGKILPYGLLRQLQCVAMEIKFKKIVEKFYNLIDQ